MTPKEVLETARENEARVVDLKFCDLLGAWQHLCVPVEKLTKEAFADGFSFDASLVRGFKSGGESNILLIPDPETARMDPFTEVATLSILCDMQDPITRAPYLLDPRDTAKKAEKYLKGSGIANTAYFGAEAEFYLFDEVRGNSDSGSDEATRKANRTEGQDLGQEISRRGGFPVPPQDKYQDIRTEMMLTMLEAGLGVEGHSPRAGGAGQACVGLKFQSLLRHADDLLLYKYIVKNVAHQNGLTATFMPKPLFQERGSGMPINLSLWKSGQSLMFDANGDEKLSHLALYYIGGILEHAPAILAFAAPTTNSYRRLIPGDDAPVSLTYSAHDLSACCRISESRKTPAATCIEFRPPDPSANPYLAFSAILMAGLDGIQNKILPPRLKPDTERAAQTPGSLGDALNALESDHAFLLQGEVFSKDLIETYVAYKRVNEIDALRRRPHPYEFALYYDV